MADLLAEVKALPKARIWFYRPQWYWFGWETLLPVQVGHDDCARRVLTLGWTITGRINIALGYCGDEECYRGAIEWSAYSEFCKGL